MYLILIGLFILAAVIVMGIIRLARRERAAITEVHRCLGSALRCLDNQGDAYLHGALLRYRKAYDALAPHIDDDIPQWGPLFTRSPAEMDAACYPALTASDFSPMPMNHKPDLSTLKAKRHIKGQPLTLSDGTPILEDLVRLIPIGDDFNPMLSHHRGETIEDGCDMEDDVHEHRS